MPHSDRSPTKLFFAIKRLSVEGGGAERVFATVCNGLAARGHRIHILSFDDPGACPFYSLTPSLEWHCLGIGRAIGKSTLSEAIRRTAALRRAALKLAPDAAVGFMHSMYLPLGVALKGTGIPVIASEHTVPAHYAGRPVQRWLLNLTPHLSRRMTIVSEQARRAFPERLRRHMDVVPNPVSPMGRSRADVRGRDGGRKTLLSVGSLVEGKNHALLIDAFANVAHQVPDWDLKIFGEGNQRSALEAQVAQLGIEGRVFLPGTTNNIEAEYAKAHLFVLPSRYESFGLALLEALSCGLPAVGFSHCPGVNALIKPNVNGLLVDGKDAPVEGLSRALSDLMADPDLRSRLSSTAPPALDQNNLERVLDDWERMFARVTG